MCVILYVLYTFFIFVQCHHMSLWTSWSSLLDMAAVSVTDFWGWEAHEAQLRCPDDVSGDIGRMECQEGP